MPTFSLYLRPRTRRRLWRAVGVALFLTVASACAPAPAPEGASSQPSGHASLSAVTPDDEAFFTPPDPLPAGEPGDIVRSRPALAGPPTAQGLAEAWQVMYLSTDALGAPTTATGMVIVPRGGDPTTMPIVGFGPGTHGPAFRCAPSGMVDEGGFYEQSALNDMLRAGYAVALTDYQGYRPEPESSYIVGHAMGPALLDAVRAAARLDEAGLSADAAVVLRGYSQGGGAALWAGELQPSYAPELDLVAVAGGGVPADLVQVALPLEGGAGFGFLLTSLVGLDNAYPELRLADYLNDAGRQAVADLEADDCTLELLTDYPGGRIQDVTTTSPVVEPEWLARVVENRLGSQPIEVPVFQYHEVGDGLVAFPQADTLHREYCERGVVHTWRTYDTGSESPIVRHVNLVYQANVDVNAFIADRLAGTPAGTTC